MILNNASYAKHNGDEIALMKLDGVIVFRNQRFRCVEYTVNDNRVNPLNYREGNGLPLLYKSADDYSTDYYEQIEIILKDGTITTDVTTRCDLISKVKVWWPSSVIGISFAHGTTKLVKKLDYVYILPSFENYYPFFEHGEKNYNIGDSVVTSLNVSNWNVPNCHNMFRLLTSLKTLTGLENWDTSNSVSMSHMFQNCSSLTSLNLSNWNTSKVKSMSFMFSGCSSLTSLGDISTWDTRKVENMGTMFDNCSKLTSLDLSGWHTDSLEETAYMFDGCSALETLDIRNFDFSNIGSNRHDMFRDCYALREIRLNNCDKDTISKIIGINAGFPRRDSTNGTKGKIYVKRENVADLEEPQGWEFVYVN
jgi:surface protein